MDVDLITTIWRVQYHNSAFLESHKFAIHNVTTDPTPLTAYLVLWVVSRSTATHALTTGGVGVETGTSGPTWGIHAAVCAGTHWKIWRGHPRVDIVPYQYANQHFEQCANQQCGKPGNLSDLVTWNKSHHMKKISTTDSAISSALTMEIPPPC